MKWRIWLLSLGITIVCVLIFGFASTQVYYKSSVDDSKNFLRVYMNEFDRDEYPLDERGAELFSAKLNGARVTFMDAQGGVIADSMADAVFENHADRAEIKDAIFKEEGFAVRGSSTLGKNMVYYCKNFDKEFLVRIAVFTDSDYLIFVKTLPTLAAFAGLAIILSALVAFFATHSILTPVKKLATEAVENDEVSTNSSELKPLADILNERNRKIKVQLDEIKAEKEAADRAHLSKDEFIANVTHEMNTPLTSIHGYAELLSAGGMTDEQTCLAYETILAQSERLTNLIACIINYSRIESDDPPTCEVDFSAIVKETVRALRPEADKRNVTIEEEIEENVILKSSHERLNELIGNLLRNAIKYNKDGGSVTVTLNREKLSVADTGVGISEENMEKVFSRFFTVDKSHGGKNGGFGLGLAVVKKICDKSGWTIGVDSMLGQGSAFTVTF